MTRFWNNGHCYYKKIHKVNSIFFIVSPVLGFSIRYGIPKLVKKWRPFIQHPQLSHWLIHETTVFWQWVCLTQLYRYNLFPLIPFQYHLFRLRTVSGNLNWVKKMLHYILSCSGKYVILGNACVYTHLKEGHCKFQGGGGWGKGGHKSQNFKGKYKAKVEFSEWLQKWGEGVFR